MNSTNQKKLIVISILIAPLLFLSVGCWQKKEMPLKSSFKNAENANTANESIIDQIITDDLSGYELANDIVEVKEIDGELVIELADEALNLDPDEPDKWNMVFGEPAGNTSQEAVLRIINPEPVKGASPGFIVINIENQEVLIKQDIELTETGKNTSKFQANIKMGDSVWDQQEVRYYINPERNTIMDEVLSAGPLTGTKEEELEDVTTDVYDYFEVATNQSYAVLFLERQFRPLESPHDFLSGPAGYCANNHYHASRGKVLALKPGTERIISRDSLIWIDEPHPEYGCGFAAIDTGFRQITISAHEFGLWEQIFNEIPFDERRGRIDF